MATFGSFTFDVVEEKFNIREVDEIQLLTEWLSAKPDNEFEYKKLLSKYSYDLSKKAIIWNEDELKMFFIGPLIELADMATPHFQPFTQRMIGMNYNGEDISGRVDFMIATGRRLPKAPYFCIHEYKQEPDKDGEPIGQALIAMVTAQYLNETKFPILGAYVIGRFWFFMVLDGDKYAKSIAFDATTEDIFLIFAILQKSKEIMLRYF